MTFFNGLVYKMLKMFSRCQIRFHDIARMLNLPMSFWGLSDQRSHDHCALQRALNILKSFLITFRTLIVNFSMIKGSSILVFLFLPLRPWASNWWTLLLTAVSRVHPFLQFINPGANPRRIDDRNQLCKSYIISFNTSQM
jgi:hypothetical protein